MSKLKPSMSMYANKNDWQEAVIEYQAKRIEELEVENKLYTKHIEDLSVENGKLMDDKLRLCRELNGVEIQTKQPSDELFQAAKALHDKIEHTPSTRRYLFKDELLALKAALDKWGK